MSEITKAIEARQPQITRLQSDIETLQRAASIMGGRAATSAKPTHAAQPTTTRQRPKPKPKTKLGQHPWSAARREAMSKRMKERWATRRLAAKRGKKR